MLRGLSLALSVLALVACDSGKPGASPAQAPTSQSPSIPSGPPPTSTPTNPWPKKYDYLGLVNGSQVGGRSFQTGLGCLKGLTDGLCVDVTVDGEPQPSASLEAKVVQLRATLTPEGSTATVDIRRAVVGPVEAVDIAHARVTVLGQQVFLYRGEGVFLHARNPARPAVGDLVEVNGYVGADGQIFATRIDPAPATGPFVVRGILVGGNGGPLRVGALDVDLSAASLDGFPASAPLAGDAVVLIGSHAPQRGSFTVDRGRFEGGAWDSHLLYEGHALFIEGVVTAGGSPIEFEVGGRPVFVDDCLCDPFAAFPPSIGTPISLQTAYSDGGVTKVSTNIGVYSTVEITGPVEQVDLAQRRLRVLGFDIQALPVTYVAAGGSPRLGTDDLTLADLAVGDVVHVAGQRLDSMLVASSILRTAGGPRIFTEVYEADFPNFWLLNQSIATDPDTIVVMCESCTNSGQVAAFPKDQYFPPMLTIDLASATPPLRAARILVELQ